MRIEPGHEEQNHLNFNSFLHGQKSSVFTNNTPHLLFLYSNLLIPGCVYCFFFTTWEQSYLPRMTFSFTPGRSWVLPPSTSTTLCSWRLCPSPGINTTASFPLESRTRAHFLFAELGFFGFRIIVLSTTAFI